MPYISLITFGFVLFGFLIADVLILSQVLGEKYEVEAKHSQESKQNKPKRPNMDDPRQKPAVQGKSKTRHTRSELGKMDREHDGP